MAKSKKKSISVIGIIIALIIGIVGGALGYVYLNSPYDEQLVIGDEVYYSYNETPSVNHVDITSSDGTMSIHFLELGNKYTGDCTYIKVGEDIDILIDCGSKSNSIPTITSYLNQYVTDGTLEYVIVTHAHQDHYAGFATNANVDSIFDLYECENIIDFAMTNQDPDAKTFGNYIREREAEKEAGANHFTALQCYNEELVEQADGEMVQAQREYVLDQTNNISFEILYQQYYEETFNRGENNYSVCVLFSHRDRNYLFTGDLEEEGEESLVAENALPEVDVYKAGHHGSGTSSTSALLKVIKPKIVCVCCCAGSSEYTSTPKNQFPTQAFIDRISEYTTQVYVTTLCIDYKNDEYTSFNGNIVILSYSDSDELGINCTNNTTVLKDTEWFKNNRDCPTYWQSLE